MGRRRHELVDAPIDAVERASGAQADFEAGRGAPEQSARIDLDGVHEVRSLRGGARVVRRRRGSFGTRAYRRRGVRGTARYQIDGRAHRTQRALAVFAQHADAPLEHPLVGVLLPAQIEADLLRVADALRIALLV